MRLYSVLLVDDEEDAVQVIMKKINWESMGFRIAGYAGNGIEALEMAEKAQPDVVMTDIRMPYMDGLSLSRKLKELYPNIRIIIFSGFDDFEYAREAIQIEMEPYLTAVSVKNWRRSTCGKSGTAEYSVIWGRLLLSHSFLKSGR